MSETAKTAIPTPMEFFFDGRRFLQYGISPVKLAAIEMKERKKEKETRKNPIIKDGVPYVLTAEGKMVRLEHFDPETMEKFTLTKDAVLTKEQVERMREFASMPVEVDEECPEISDDQIATILQKAIDQKNTKK